MEGKTKMTQILGPSRGYVDLLNEATTAMLKKEGPYNKTPLRPSAAGKCTRELFFELMEYSGKAKYDKELKSPEVHRLLSLGNSVEWHVLKQFELLKDFVELKYRQQSLSFAYLHAENDPKLSQWVEGSLDMVLWSEKFKCVADVKSKKDGFYRPRKTRWDDTSDKLTDMASVAVIGDSGDSFWVEDLEAFLWELNDAFFAANFLQVNLYANADFLKERGVDHGAIIQYSKNDSRLREVRFKPSEKLAKDVIKKFQTVLTAADTNNIEMAPRDYAKGVFKCKYCPFQKECWGKGK